VMERDALLMRGNLPFIFTNLLSEKGLDEVVHWIKKTFNDQYT